MTEEQGTTAGLDRRAALKKAAIAAGVVAWTTPTVQALTPAVASAQSGVTNCFPAVTFKLIFTEGTCKVYNASHPKISPSCCNNHTFFAAFDARSCGKGCTVTGSTEPAITAAPKIVSCEGASFADLTNCSGSASVSVQSTITCLDGATYNCTYTANFDCSGGAGTGGKLSCTKV